MSNAVRDVFNDYTKGSNILDASIENVNLYKKTNKLEIDLKTDKKINVGEIYYFEEYLKNHPEVKELYLCLDGDEPGRKATQTIAQKYMQMGYKVFDCPPRTKDYNQDLVSFLNQKIREQTNISQKR